MAEKEKEFDIDEAFERLEEINSTLAAGERPLKESMDLYKEGVTLAAKCKEHLEGVEQELQIVNQSEGE